MTKLLLAIITALTVSLAQAQSFEVASIKPSAKAIGREGGSRSRIEHTPTSLTMWNVTLSECVQWAYGVPPFQISAAHLSSDSYDVLAKTEGPVPVSQLRVKLQNLLATRFKLQLHRESKMLPVYELVVAKGGPKLPAPQATAPVHAAESLPRVQNDSFLFSGVSMTDFAQMLMQLRGIELPIVDRTAIVGSYDLALKSAPSAVRDGDTTALFAILQDQLGLRLAAAKAPFEILVIDHSEKPDRN